MGDSGIITKLFEFINSPCNNEKLDLSIVGQTWPYYSSLVGQMRAADFCVMSSVSVNTCEDLRLVRYRAR